MRVQYDMSGHGASTYMPGLGERCCSLLGLYRLLHRGLRRHALTIVAYHGIIADPLGLSDWCFLARDRFRLQIDYLKKYFRVVPLSEGVELLRNGSLDEPTAAITFDDGYQNQYEVAFPILQEAKAPATIFLSTGVVNTDGTFWFCRLHQALAMTRESRFEWEGNVFDLSSPLSRAKALAALRTSLKRYPHHDLLEKTMWIVSTLGDDPDRGMEEGSPFSAISQEALSRMAASGLIEFGGHGHRHAILGNLSAEEQRTEITDCASSIRQLTGKSMTLFSYPNGGRGDFNETTMEILKEIGVRAAVTMVEGRNGVQSNPMALGRYDIGPATSFHTFQLKVHLLR